MYWHIGFQPADYEVLQDWWAKNSFGKHIYIGHASYKVGTDKAEEWSNSNQIPRQIQMTRDSQLVLGSTFFSLNTLKKNKLGHADSIKTYYANKALIPSMSFRELPEVNAPLQEPLRGKEGKLTVKWKTTQKRNPAKYFVIYRFEGYKPGDFQDGKNILAIVPNHGKKVHTYIDESTVTGLEYTYVITAVNRNHQQSDLSNQRTIKNLGNKFRKID